MKLPDTIVTQSMDVEINLTYRTSMCNFYVTFNNSDLNIIVGTQSYVMPKSITVPAFLDQTVKTVLASDFKVEILVVTGSHFRAIPVTSMSLGLPRIDIDDRERNLKRNRRIMLEN